MANEVKLVDVRELIGRRLLKRVVTVSRNREVVNFRLVWNGRLSLREFISGSSGYGVWSHNRTRRAIFSNNDVTLLANEVCLIEENWTKYFKIN